LEYPGNDGTVGHTIERSPWDQIDRVADELNAAIAKHEIDATGVPTSTTHKELFGNGGVSSTRPSLSRIVDAL